MGVAGPASSVLLADGLGVAGCVEVGAGVYVAWNANVGLGVGEGSLVGWSDVGMGA